MISILLNLSVSRIIYGIIERHNFYHDMQIFKVFNRIDLMELTYGIELIVVEDLSKKVQATLDVIFSQKVKNSKQLQGIIP